MSASLRAAPFELTIGAMNILDSRYQLGHFEYVSDGHTQSAPTTASARHFAAGMPRTLFVTFGAASGT